MAPRPVTPAPAPAPAEAQPGEYLLRPLDTNNRIPFSCDGKQSGLYGDPANQCQVNNLTGDNLHH